MSIVWACCSSGRPEMIKTKTLLTLANCGFTGDLFICVPHEEVATYTIALKGYPIILIGAQKGLVNQRKHIRSLWPPGQEIVFIDDDISRLKFLAGGKVHPVANINALVDMCFQTIHHLESPLMWGVYPMVNRDWMKMREAIGNCYVPGGFYGIINDPRLEEPEVDEMEDWARCLSEQAAGRPPVRFEWVGFVTRCFLPPGNGGMQRSKEERTRVCQALATKYPDLVKIKSRKEGLDLKCLKKPAYAARILEISVPSESADQSTPVAEGAEALTGGDP
jgi:hypothetical protein